MATSASEADAAATALAATSGASEDARSPVAAAGQAVSPSSTSPTHAAGDSVPKATDATDRKSDRDHGRDSASDKLLKEKVREEYEPSAKEIQEYAEWLGIDARADPDLLWIATKGLKTPLPDPWKPCESGEGEIFYFNPQTGKSTWDHPCDDELRQLYQRERAKKQGVNINWDLAGSDDAETLAERLRKEKQERQERMQKVPRPPAVPKKEGTLARKSLGGTVGGSSSPSSSSSSAPPAPPSTSAPIGSLPAPLPPLSLPKGAPLLDLGLPPLEDMPALDVAGLGSPLFKSPSSLAGQKELSFGSPDADKASRPEKATLSTATAAEGDIASLGEILPADSPGPLVGIGGASGLQRSSSEPGFSRLFDDEEDFRSPKRLKELDKLDESPAPAVKDKVVVRHGIAGAENGHAPTEIKLKLDKKLQSMKSPEVSNDGESMSIVEELGPPSPESIAELIGAGSPGAPAKAAAGPEASLPSHSALALQPKSPSSTSPGAVEDCSVLRKRLQEMEVELKSARADRAELERLRADREAGASTAASLKAELAQERSSKRALQSEAAEAAALRKAKADLKDENAAAARELERARRESASNLSEVSALEWRAAHAEAACEQQKRESQDLKLSLALRREEVERLLSELKASGSAPSDSRKEETGRTQSSAAKCRTGASSSASASQQQQQQQQQQQGASESSSSPPTPQLASILQAELRPEDSKFSLWSHIEDGSRTVADSLELSSLSAVLETPPEECAEDGEDSMVEELYLLKGSPGVKERSITGGSFNKSCSAAANAGESSTAACRGQGSPSTSQPASDRSAGSKPAPGKTAGAGELASSASRTPRLSADAPKSGSESSKARKPAAQERGDGGGPSSSSERRAQDPAKTQPKPPMRSGGLSPPSTTTSPSALLAAGTENSSANQDPLRETLHATLRQHTVDVATLRGDTADVSRRPQDAGSRLGGEAQEPPPSPAAAAAAAAAASSAAAVREARREAQRAREAAQAAEDLLQETRAALEQERSARESLRVKAGEAQREVASLRTRLKSKEVECERMSLDLQRCQADLAEREVETNQVFAQLQARDAELGQLRQQRRALTQQSDTEMQRQRFELGAREQVLNDRERFLQERENLAGEAEMMLHKRRRELQADMQRAELAGLRATVAELGVPAQLFAMQGGECQDPSAGKRPRDNGGARRSSSVRPATSRRALSAERRPTASGADALLPQRSASVTRQSPTGASRAAAAGRDCGAREGGAEGRRGGSSPRWQVPLVLASSEESTPPRESLHAVEGVSPSSPSSDGSLRQLAPDCGGVGSSTEAGLLGSAAPSPSAGPAALDMAYFKRCPVKELADLLRSRRRELRSEHATLEEERRRWRHDAREARRSSPQGDSGIAHLAEARNDLDARAAALNRSISDYRTLEQLLSQRQRSQGSGGGAQAANGEQRGAGASDDEPAPSGRRPSKASLQHSTQSGGSAQRSVSSPGVIVGPSVQGGGRRGERGASSRGGYTGGTAGRGLPADGAPFQYMMSLSGGDLGMATTTPRTGAGSFRRAGSECQVPRVAEQRAALAPAGGA